ncbi:MAG: glycerol-3-phosphate acyltransferase [Chloroflexi bacterium]|nr:glycerol-3-phosphate acyltransferase [Chloroflexota bacterium]
MVLEITLIIITAYLLGSIPSAYIVGRLVKGVDMREVGDGRMGTNTVVRRLGITCGITVAVMDFGKGAVVVILALVLDAPLIVVLLAGMVAVAGHNWSIFIGFKGGQGLAPTFGALASLVFWQFFIDLGMPAILYFGLAVVALTYLFLRKAGVAAGIMLTALPIAFWITGGSPLLIAFPLILTIPMLVKHFLVVRAESVTGGDCEALR